MVFPFRTMLEARWEAGLFLCIGLDPDIEKIPAVARIGGTHETILNFNRAIVDATHDLACAFKPNIAFYERHGDQGWDALRSTIAYINEVAPDVPVILDAKRADIGNTNEAYASSAFDHLRAHAITVNPYPGKEALAPFLSRKDNGIFVWCRTSNDGASEFQDLLIDKEPLYKVVARHVSERWNENGNCALVVGATYPDELGEIREIVKDMPILIPGIGAQSGDLERSVAAGKDKKRKGIILNAARAILYASHEKDYAAAARKKAEEFSARIGNALR